MKKKYFAPEMDELELDEPFLLSDNEASPEQETIGWNCDAEGEG